MSESTTAGPTDHFDPANRAWQRFHTIAPEQVDIVTWEREDGRPVLLSLIDLYSGDVVTLAVIDSHEMRDPHALLTLTTDPAAAHLADPACATTRLVLSARGPFDGPNAAESHAPQLAAADPTVAGTCTIPLHHPGQPKVPDSAWVAMPPDLAATVAVDAAPAGAAPVAVLLLDRDAARHALVGPFPHHRAALAWQPDPATGPDRNQPELDQSGPRQSGPDRYVVGLHPAPAIDPPA